MFEHTFNGLLENLQYNPLFFYSFIAIVSLIIGSLLNLIIYRLPHMLYEQMQSECEDFYPNSFIDTSPKSKFLSLNLFFPRSFCPYCRTPIKALHNIPLLSYIFLKGRCAHCKHPIDMRYPFVEAITLGVSMLAAWHFGYGAQLVYALLFLWISMVLIVIDIQHQLLPDVLTLSLLWLGLFANTESLFTSLHHAVVGAAAAYLLLWLFIKIFYICTGKIGMGNGDFKLFAALCAWFGPQALPFILITSAASGVILGIVYLKLQKKPHNTPIPFGPFLSLSGIIYLFFANKINFLC